MASESELLLAVKEVLSAGGQLNKIQAEMRSYITKALSIRQGSGEGRTQPPAATGETALINELIREYLEWNGYLYTASVLATEAGLSKDKPSRISISSDVGVKDDERSSALPLLTNIVTAYTERIRRKINKNK